MPVVQTDMFMPGIYVRYKEGADRIRTIFPPLPDDHSLIDAPCLACGYALNAGHQRLALMAIGPGEDLESRDKARAGKWYNAVAIPFHVTCIGLAADIPYT